MVEIRSTESVKIVSIAQDLIYTESNGKKQTHKAPALGMTVQQITGSVRLLRILHGLRHTVSTDTICRHDTALAISSSNGAEKEIAIPQNMSSESFTTIVWDNNDFNNKTVSRKGTAHVANGIIIQKKDVGQTLGEKKSVSKKNRTIEAPEAIETPKVYKEIQSSSNIGYLPVIDAPVTHMSTVNTLLRQSVSICQRLQVLEVCLCVLPKQYTPKLK